jgi:phosphate-selective porin
MTRRSRRRIVGSVAMSFPALVLLAGSAFCQEKKDTPVSAFLQSLKLSGYVQAYGAVWDNDTDTFSLRRARVALAGELVKNLRFKLSVDVAKSQPRLDAAVEFEPVGLAGARVGQFVVPFSLENDASSADLDLIDRAAVVDTPASRSSRGKLQTPVRYETLDLDRSVAGNATSVSTLGLNWMIAGKTKLQLNYEIHGLQAGGRAKSGLLAQLQAAF